MEIYKLEKARYSQYRKSIINRTVPIFLLLLVLGLISLYFQLSIFGGNVYQIIIITAAIALGTMIVTIGVSILIEKRSFELFRLKIETDRIERYRGKKIRNSILKSNVSDIIECRDSTIIIKSRSKNVIVIPPYIENRSNLRVKLYSFGSIKQQPEQSVFRKILPYSYLLLFILFSILRNPDWSMVIGILILVLLLYSVLRLILDRNTTLMARIISVLMLLFFGFYVVRRMMLIDAF